LDAGDKLFDEVLSERDRQGILQQFILIGGWCQKIYRYNFDNPPELSALRTADIDLLVREPKKIKKNVDIKDLFKSYGFDEDYSTPEGYVKYVHPEMEIELLVPAVGRSSDKPFQLKKLNTNAQRLRYLDIVEKYAKEIEFKGLKIIVPEPAAFVINKFIASQRRKDKGKKEKDLITAKEFGEYILDDPKQKVLLKEIFGSLKPRLQRSLLKEIENISSEIYEHLIS